MAAHQRPIGGHIAGAAETVDAPGELYGQPSADKQDDDDTAY
jgi:hypothetical protein